MLMSPEHRHNNFHLTSISIKSCRAREGFESLTEMRTVVQHGSVVWQTRHTMLFALEKVKRKNHRTKAAQPLLLEQGHLQPPARDGDQTALRISQEGG